MVPDGGQHSSVLHGHSFTSSGLCECMLFESIRKQYKYGNEYFIDIIKITWNHNYDLNSKAAHGFHQPYAFTGNGQPVYYYQPQQLGQHPPFQVAYVNQQAQQQPPLPQMIPVKQEESSTPTV